MKPTYHKILLLIFTSFLVGCVTNSPVQSTQTTSVSHNSGNMKFYPYKSGILKFKKNNRSLTWDAWGKRTYETNRNEAIVINNGSEYRIDHDHKQIKKTRNLILDWLIVADQDLHSYYVSKEARGAMVNMHKTEMVAGVKCNIWLDNVPHPSNRYCLYDNRILLKHQVYNNKRWSVRKEASFANFNSSIDQNLFTKLPSYPVKNLTKYNNDEALHARMRNSSSEYKNALQIANRMKALGVKREKDVKRYARDHKGIIELYNNHRIGNGVYYPKY